MASSASVVGVVGLSVMGQNLALNIATNGFKVLVYNRTAEKVDDCITRAKREGLEITGFKDIVEFVRAIPKPRIIILMVQAGPAVDALLEQFQNDIIIDGGNEWYEKTAERTSMMEKSNFRYMGMGVSGGESGARWGPALMPGGTKEAYNEVKHILEAIAAKVPCVSYIGPGGAGHYVKMVHNGIEYGDMQLICETYALLKRVCKFSPEKLTATFSVELQSYLISITADIFGQKDESCNYMLLDLILDVAGSKGTGMWTVREAAIRGVPCPTIQAALDSRYMSTLKSDRAAAARVYADALGEEEQDRNIDIEKFTEDIRRALYCCKICVYTQGFMLLKKTSADESWNLNMSEIARGWMGGCILRARLLEPIHEAFSKNQDLPSLLVDQKFSDEIKARLPGWRRVVSLAQLAGIAVPALSASLNYFDAYVTAQLPVNLIQAQRDYFGAHTYQRIDKVGVFHTNWNQEEK